MFYIDVSHHDWNRNGGNLDWRAIKAAGIDTVCIRATYGDPQTYAPTTEHFREMADAAHDYGLYVGAYHNLIRGDQSSVDRQVTSFMQELIISDAEWAMLDVEPYDALKTNNLWPRLEDAMRFANRFVAENDEHKLAIYIARWVWQDWLGSASLVPLLTTTKGMLVSANYPNGNPAGNYKDLYVQQGGPTGLGFTAYGGVAPAVWQYSSKGIVPGASPTTDLNAFRGSTWDFHRATRYDTDVYMMEQAVATVIRNAYLAVD